MCYFSDFMSWILIAAATAGLCIASGQTQWIADGHAIPRIGIFLDFDRNPSESSIQAMQREVADALGAIGAQFSWLTLNSDNRAETFDELAILHFLGDCRMEKLAGTAGVEPMTLGQTDMVSGSVSAYSRVECDQIKTCISGLLGSACPRDRDAAFGRALGRVVAHELFHILGKTTEHARSGVSKGVQTSFDLIRENFHFDRQALLWLRQQLFSALGRSAAGPPIIEGW
jgi:hypothetical protein